MQFHDGNGSQSFLGEIERFGHLLVPTVSGCRRVQGSLTGTGSEIRAFRVLISYRTITVPRRPSIAIEDVAGTGTSFRSQVVGV